MGYEIRHSNKGLTYKEALYHQFPNEEEMDKIVLDMANYLVMELNDRLDKLEKK